MAFGNAYFLLIAPLASFFVLAMFAIGECKKRKKLKTLADETMRRRVLVNFDFVNFRLKVAACAIIPILYALILARAKISSFADVRCDISYHLSHVLIVLLASEQLLSLRKSSPSKHPVPDK
ncbi:MAG: hypothetical protein LBT64_00575 [Puniceicoccales bacterium]|jgi:hypothetical protein|nr:hypothetical protein [Puniceicoccales bacterium]